MLKEVFRSVPIPYMLQSEYKGGYFLGIHGDKAPAPYVEKLRSLNGLLMYSQHPTPDSLESRLYLFATMETNYYPMHTGAYWVFDGKTGQVFRRMDSPGTLFVQINLSRQVTASRKGVIYTLHFYGRTLLTLTLGFTATALYGEEPELKDTWSIVGGIAGAFNEHGLPSNHFKMPNGDPLIGFIGPWAVDDIKDVFLMGYFSDLMVWTLSTGAYRYTITMPENVAAICLEDDSHAYILLRDATVVLFDYVRGEVLGASRLPRLKDGLYDNSGDFVLAWDTHHRWLLIAEKVPDNENGSSATVIRGYRMVPEPVRLTLPIPLKAARQGRTIPVLTQVVGDRNEGIGLYIVEAVVTGAGTLVGIPITNHRGDVFISVACGDPGPVSSPGSPETES